MQTPGKPLKVFLIGSMVQILREEVKWNCVTYSVKTKEDLKQGTKKYIFKTAEKMKLLENCCNSVDFNPVTSMTT